VETPAGVDVPSGVQASAGVAAANGTETSTGIAAAAGAGTSADGAAADGAAADGAAADGAAADGAEVPGGRRRSRDDDAYDRRRSGMPVRRRTTVPDELNRPLTGGRTGIGSGDAVEPVVAGPLRPGDIAQTRATFWNDEATRQFHAEWHEVKAQFVDDPVIALIRAHDLLTEAVQELTGSLLAQRDELDPLRATSTPDTESMRMAMRNYREFLDRILAL
jgi:hypothetical protein